MKKQIIPILFLIALSFSAFAETSIRQDACFYNYAFDYEFDSPKTMLISTPLAISSRTIFDVDFNLFNFTSEFIANDKVITTNNTLKVKYDINDNFQVFGCASFNYTSIMETTCCKAIRYGYTLYSDAYIGARLNADVWKINFFAEGSFGYNYLDKMSLNTKTSVSMTSVSRSDNGFIVDLKLGASYGKYVKAFAGIKSWQNPKSIFSWWPFSIENYIGIDVDIPVYNNISIVCTALHSCRHAEVPIGSTYPKKDIAYSVLSIGAKFTF